MQISFVLLFVLLLVLSNFPIHGHGISYNEYFQQPFRYCSNATFSPNSTYFSNLKSLSTTLSSNASRKSYHNSSATTVYGDYQCRGDLDATVCQRCVATATKSSQNYCPFSIEAVIWLDRCFLRYSNYSFFSLLREEPSWGISNPDFYGGDDVDGFKKIVGSTLNETVTNASSSSGHVRLFGTKEASFRGETIYTLAQCTRDLSTSKCGKCLTRAAQGISSCCSGRKGARVLLFSCIVRYELYPFYNGVLISSVAPPPAVPLPSPPPASEVPPPAESPPVSLNPSPAQSPQDYLNPSPPPPSLLSSPSAQLTPSTAPPSLLSGKGKKIIVAMVIGFVV